MAIEDVLSGLDQLPGFLTATRATVAEQQQTIIALQARIAELVGQMRDAQDAARAELASARASLQTALDAKEAERAQAVATAAEASAKMAAMADHPDVKAERLRELEQQAAALDAQRADLAKLIEAAKPADVVPASPDAKPLSS